MHTKMVQRSNQLLLFGVGVVQRFGMKEMRVSAWIFEEWNRKERKRKNKQTARIPFDYYELMLSSTTI